jgi:hypothetical protein
VAPADESLSQSSSLVDFAHTVNAALKRKDEAFMRDVFLRHAGSKGELFSPALMVALEEVEAPVLNIEGASTEDIFRHADANMSGSVDFEEFDPALHRFKLIDVR